MNTTWTPRERFLMADNGQFLTDSEAVSLLAAEIDRLRSENARLLAWVAAACSGGPQRGGYRLVRVAGMPPVLVGHHPDGPIRVVALLGDPEAAT